MNLGSALPRFFLALLPPLAIQADVNGIKQEFAERYDSHAAQKSPPHITLQPPFVWRLDELPTLVQWLREFALTQVPLTVRLDGFGAFPPRVVFIHVEKTPALMTLQHRLAGELAVALGIVAPNSQRPFTPHLTVAFRDLSPANFRLAWQEYGDRPLYFEFTVERLTLLIHDGQRWLISHEFPMQKA